MKIFKKVISLVLVFAMLASFAGMTGYSPASIIAEAESQTFTVGDGKFSVKIPTVLYKSIADGTEASHSSTSTGKEIAGDYIFTAANNPDMAHKFTRLDASIICWQVEWSINGMPFSGFWGSVTADSVDRGTPASAWTSDYSYILASAPWGTLRGKGGYSDVNEIRCRIVYNTVTDTVHDTANRKYTEEWSIPVEFAPSNPSNNTSSTKPLDSKSGINQATIDMPPVLYMNSNGVIVNSIGSSSTTTTLDTTLAITLPSGVTSATLKAVDYGSDSTVYKTWNLASGSNSVDFNGLAGTALTNGNPYLCLRLDYTMNVAHTPYNTPTGNILDSTYDQAASVGKSAYYDNTYGDKSAPDTVTVTYTQYIAAFVTTLPRYYQVGWQFDLGTKYSGAEQSLAGVIMLDMAPALATDGINIYGSIRSGESGDYSNAALRENWLESRGSLGLSQTQNNALIWYNDEKKTSCGRNSGVYTSGQFSDSGANSSNRTLGGTIYYDSTTTSAVNLNMKYDFTSSNHTCDKNELEGFWLTWYNGGQRLGYDVTQDGVAGTYLGDGISSHANSNAADSGGLAAYGNVVTKTGGTYPNSGMNFQSSDTTVNFSFNLANATAAGTPYWRCVQQINRPEYSTWGMATNLRCIWGFHIDAIAVDRAAEHYVMTQAISKNFVQAEMDATWWSEYRDEVLFGYYDCGDLRNSGGVEGLFDDKIANGYATDAPVYKTANISELEAAILRTPAYDRGTSQRDANLAAFGLVPVGSKYGDVIAYADGGAQSVDPAVPNATYYNNDTAGNGLNNIDNAAYYRYSGTYFYTDETWRPYATERYYALNIQKYPSANLDVFWYGAGYIYGAGGTFCYCYMQSYIDATTDRLNTAYNNLELRTLAEFKMRNDKNPSDDYDGDGVADNVTAGNGAWVKDSNGNQIIGYDAIMAYLASLIPTDTYTYYTTLSDANGNGKIDALDLDGDGYIDDLNPRTAQVYDTTHLEALLSQMQSKFHEDDSVVDMGLEFEAYIENFLALVEITKRNPQNADNSAWTAIFTYLNGTSVAGDLRPSTGLKAVNFVDEVSKVYTLTTAQKNNFQSLIDTYNTAAAPDPTTYVTTRNALSQGSINTAIGNFFVALQDAFPSIKVIEGGTQANNIAKDPTAVFEIYAPNQSANITQSIYTADSIAALEAAVNAELGTNSYQFSTTTWQSLVDRYDTIVNWATVHNATTNPDGKLVSSKVNTDRMDIALQNAQNALAADKTSISVTSPDGKTTVAHGKYTPKSVAELEFVIDQAQNIDRNQLYTNQLAVDMITFALWDECDDTKGLLLTSDTALAPRTWSYDASGNPTGYTDDWGSVIMKSFLYGERVEEGNGTDEGLKPNTAYYGFLEAEIKGNTIIRTVINEETGEVISTTVIDEYIGTVWNADGSLILNDNGEPAGKRIFENWSSYMDAYTAAVTLFNAQDKTVDQQTAVDDAAKLLYDKRNALKELSLYFPNNTQDFETAKGWYNELSAYVQKTDVTRYGWEYVDVTEEVTDETTGEVTTVTTTVFQKSENPLSSVTQSVYIYNGVTPEIEAEIESFRAKYASDNSTEDYNSLGAAQTLYNNIKTTLTDPSTGVLYTVKKTNDESLIAGMLDLTGRIDPETQELVGGYIAGTWTVTFDEETGASTGVYATDLLNSTQAGLLQTYLTNAQNKINSKTDATAGFGGALGALTTIVFDETKKPATDLQFASAMKQQIEGFMDMTFDIQLPTFYNGGNTITAPVFGQKMVAEYKGDIKTFYEETYEWPAIYQIHGLKVEQSAASNTKDNYFVTQYPNSGEPYLTNTIKNGNSIINNATTSYTNLQPKNDDEVDNKIYELFTELGGKSHYYSDILGHANSYHTASLAWIVDNALGKTAEIDGAVVDVILADLNSNVNGDAGSKITVEDTLLTNINNANLPLEQWSTVMIDVNYDVRVTSSWYTEGYGETVDNRVYYNYNWFNSTKIATLNSTLSTAQTQIKNQFKITDYNETTQLIVPSAPTAQVNQIKNQCWTSTRGNNLSSTITTAQGNIKKQAQLIYDAIRALELLPATEAYRDVYNTYLSIFGQHIDDGNWNGDSYSSATTISNVDFKFYNINDTQLSRIAGMYSELNYDAAPPYGTVLRASYSGFLDKYTQSGEYADQENNPWYSMETYITNFIDAGATITIDQAAKVNTYDKTDNITSIMETLVDEYLSNLEFDDLVYDNLDEVVKAFLGDNLANGLAAVKTTLQNMGFTVGVNYEGQFYPLSYYTDDSLLQVAGILRSQNVLADGKIIEKIINTDTYKWIGDTFPLPIVFNSDYKGSFYTSTTDQNKIDSSKAEHNSVLLAFLTALNTQLVLKGVDTEKLVEQITLGDAIVPQKYDTTQPAWAEYEDALADAKDYRDRAGEYDIRDQVSVIDAATSRLAAAIEALKEIVLADNYAPSMTLKTSVAAVDEFYSKEAYEVALREADSASFTATGEGNNVTYTANPAAGTFFVPNNSGYSLIVYTNELDPRIVINLEDLEQKLADGTNGSADVMQDAAKKEYISINAVKTSGVTANVIAGTIVPAHNNIAENLTVEKALAATANQAVEVTNSSEVKGSSAFAILAPRFVEGKATQAAVYTIQARDGSERNVDGGTVYGNPVKQLEFGGAGQEPVDIKVLDSNNNIAIYIYYYSLKAADGRDEGINAAGTALAAPAIEGTNVPNILLSGEPGFKGVNWRNGVLLQRSFSSSHRVWEYVSEIKKNDKNQYNVNGTQVPVYNDPTFGQLNTGSFYYVLDDEEDADIIATYNDAKSSSTTAGCMDYAAATDAKTAMISAINAANATKLSEMKASGRFYNYGDYETDEFGNVLYNGDEPKWINWAQAIGGKVENGDLVFVHVVDRWGNVVNRIIEITNLDENAPEVSSDVAGAVTIDETGGSGLADIQVHNGDFSLGEFKYEVSQSQTVIKLEGEITNKAEVNCASNVLTIVNLVPGKTYLIGAEDKAGNRSTTAVKADAEGHIVLTIDNKIVQTGEDMGLEGNSSAFTLNGTDTIILNSGEESSVINAKLEGNVFANRTIRHYITTKDNVEALKTVYQDGTVEEFTAENATVKDNGDGTLVWTIKRKLAEGEHKYDVYAKVNGKYETYYAVAVINATTRTVKIECTNVGQGATELKFSGSLSFDIANYISKEVPYGAQVTITAKAYTTYEGCEFYYWINNTTDRIINTADVYEFKAVANADYIAQFTNNSTCIDGKKFVVYVNNAKNVIDRFELAEGDDYAVPSGPVLPDYTFKGWSMTKAEVLASEKATVIVEPIYELNASYTVSIAQGSYTATGAGTYTAEANQRAVVTISTSAKDGEGKDFLYWIDADTDEIVSYDRTYSFFCVKDTELAPVYGDASTVKAEPIVRITEVKFNAFSGKASFFAERSVPEEYTILQTGIVVTKTETIGTNEEVFVVGGTSTAAGTSTSTANNGYYSASTSVATGQTVWARAYVIYETADGEILEVYGPVVSYTVD